MKNSPHATSTLSPVRRAAAFFAFLGFLTLGSCQEDQESATGLMTAQTAVFEKMTTILNEVTEGSDPEQAAQGLTALGEELKDLKIRLRALDSSGKDEAEGIAAYDYDFALATQAYEQARQKVFMSGHLTPEINRAIMAHHNPAPMSGEGTP